MFIDNSNNDYNNENNYIFDNTFSDIQQGGDDNKILSIIEPKIEEKFNYENDSFIFKNDLQNIIIAKTYDVTTKLTKSVEKLPEGKKSELEVQNNKKTEKDDSFCDSDFKNIIYNEQNEIKELKQNLKPLGKKRGRTGTTGAHNKFSDDNIRKKCKHIVLNILFHFINEKINKKYNNQQGKGIFAKKLLAINQKQKSDASILFNKDFLNKSIGDIFSEKISGKYTNFPPYHNKFLINFLKKDEEKMIINIFKYYLI